MIRTVYRFPCLINKSLTNSALRYTSATNVLSSEIRFKSTRSNNSTKKSKNAEKQTIKSSPSPPAQKIEQPDVRNIAQSTETFPPPAPSPANPQLGADPCKPVDVPPPISTSTTTTTSSYNGSGSSGSNNTSSSSGGDSGNSKILMIGGAVVLALGAGYIFLNNSSDKPAIQVVPKKLDTKPERYPATLENIPKHVPYLLIGGGTASFAAFRAIKSNQPGSKILVVSNELVMPYMRPPLSKEIWFDSDLGVEQSRFKQWNGAERSLYYEPEEFYMPAEKLEAAKNGGVSVIRGYSVKSLNVNEQKVLLDDGTELTYDKCLIATGSKPKTLEIFDTAPARIKDKIFTFKSIHDFVRVKSQVDKSQDIAIIGNGFLGSELACALAHNGQVNQRKINVYQLFHESGNMAKVLPKYLSEWSTERIREVGVDVMPSSQVTKVEEYEGKKIKLTLNNGKTIVVDTVIQAVGSEPNVSLAESGKLEVDPKLSGFVVNAELEARSNLYIAGDVACFYDPKLGRRRVEHHDHAVVSGRLAGENMVGLKKPYKHQSMFWSDLGSAVGYEAIGRCDSSLETFGVFAKIDPKDVKIEHSNENEEDDEKAPPVVVVKAETKPDEIAADNFTKGVLFYMNEGKIVGILLWNVFNRMSIARKILLSDEDFKDLNEVAKLFDIFDQHTNEDKQN